MIFIAPGRYYSETGTSNGLGSVLFSVRPSAQVHDFCRRYRHRLHLILSSCYLDLDFWVFKKYFKKLGFLEKGRIGRDPVFGHFFLNFLKLLIPARVTGRKVTVPGNCIDICIEMRPKAPGPSARTTPGHNPCPVGPI